MYELFFNFLIEELLVRYFKKINVEPGDKFYIVIEDVTLRRDFYKALHNSAFTHNYKICFPGYEKYGIGASEYDRPCRSPSRAPAGWFRCRPPDEPSRR